MMNTSFVPCSEQKKLIKSCSTALFGFKKGGIHFFKHVFGGIQSTIVELSFSMAKKLLAAMSIF